MAPSTFRKRSSRKSGMRKAGVSKRTYKRGGLTLAKLAQQVKQIKAASTVTKYFAMAGDTDVASQTNIANLIDVSNWSPIFDSAPIEGDKFFHRYMEIIWEAHCDNLNNEEETTNHTILVVQPTRNMETGSYPTGADIFTTNGQARVNPQRWKTIYRKHFVLTMGGTSPGTAGESAKSGKIFIRTNRNMVRTPGFGNSPGLPNDSSSRYFLLWVTDNTSADTENPRMNWSVIHSILDNDNN